MRSELEHNEQEDDKQHNWPGAPHLYADFQSKKRHIHNFGRGTQLPCMETGRKQVSELRTSAMAREGRASAAAHAPAYALLICPIHLAASQGSPRNRMIV